MASGLEEEIIFQVMNESDDKQYLLDRVEALRELDFKVDDEKIETAIKRYELLQNYNPKKSNLKSRINKILSERIERIKKEPGNLSVRVGRAKQVMRERYYLEEVACKRCGKYSLYRIPAKITQLQRLNNGEIIRQKSNKTLLYFCKSCQSIR